MTSPGATAVVAWAMIGAAVGAAAGLGLPRLLEASCRPRLPVLVVAISAGTSVCFGLLAVNVDGVELAAFSPGLAHLTDPDPPAPSTLRNAARDHHRALEQLTHEAGLAA